MTEKTGIERLPWYTVPGILLGVPAIVAILAWINPTTFYDNFVWKYYWGPIFADAARGGIQYHNGVPAEGGYNLVNTLSWAVLMGLCLVGLTQMLNGLKQKMSNIFILGATGWVVAGSIWHVMQDTRLYAQPLEYFFITPPIYLLFAAGGVASLLLGHDLKKVLAKRGEAGVFTGIWLFMSFVIVVYSGLWALEWGQVEHLVNPFFLVITALLTMGVIMKRVKKAGFNPEDLVLLLSIWPILMSLVYVWEFTQGNFGRGADGDLWWILVVTPLGAAATALLVRALATRMQETEDVEVSIENDAGEEETVLEPSKKTLLKRAFLSPINLVLIFSQLMDAIGTSIGLDVAHYTEKHVLSALVIDRFRDFAGAIGWQHGVDYGAFYSFITVKLLVSLLVVYAIDVSSYKDSQKNPTMIGFIKFAIIMVGIGPGVRNITRIALGV